MKIGLVKTCDILPILLPEVSLYLLHISKNWHRIAKFQFYYIIPDSNFIFA